jgi:CheY-like chemotaxis protein
VERQESSSPVDSGVSANLEGVRLLVVEDEPDTRDAIVQFLEDYGASVVAVGSAKEALERLLIEDLDVLVSDIGMPGMDGYELIRALRTHETGSGRRLLPAVAVTAFARDEDRQRVLREGFSEHLPKPVNTARLISVLMELAGKAAPSPTPPSLSIGTESAEPS